MYFEPPRKTYYRFPSARSVNDLDSKHYFSEKPSHEKDDARYEISFTSRVLERENHYDL